MFEHDEEIIVAARNAVNELHRKALKRIREARHNPKMWELALSHHEKKVLRMAQNAIRHNELLGG